jgi:hypothetical protein
MGEALGQEADDGDGGAGGAARGGRRRRIAVAVVGVCLAGAAAAVIGINALQSRSGTTGSGAAPTALGGERQWLIMVPPIRITGSDSGVGLPEPWNSMTMADLDVNPQTESVCHIYRVFDLFLHLRKDGPVGDPTDTSTMTRQLREQPQLIQTSAHRTRQLVAGADALAAYGAAPGFPEPDSLTSSPVRALKKDCADQPTS